MKILKTIKNLIAIILTLLSVFFLSIFIYYSMNSEDLNRYVYPNFIQINSIDSIHEFIKSSKIVYKHNKQLIKTVSLLAEFKKQEKKIFKGIVALFNSPGKYITYPSNQSLLIIDTGWQSLYLSTSFLAIKSIYNNNKNYRISDKELTIKNKTIKLYKFSFKNSEKKIYLTIHKNLVFISQSETAISSAFYCLSNKNKIRLKNNDLMLSTKKTRLIFKRLKHTPFYNFKDNTGYSTWSTQQTDKGLVINGEIKINRSSTGSSSKHYRVLNSNQYNLDSYQVIPKTFSEAFILLFDDLEEIYNIANKAIIRGNEKLLTKESFQWTANELGIFRDDNRNYLFIRASDINRLQKQIKRIIIFKNGNNKQNLIMPKFIQNLRKAFQLRKRFRCYTKIKDNLIFAETKESLKTLQANLSTHKGLTKKDIRILNYDKNNFIFIWKTKHPRIPLNKKISNLIKRNIGNYTGFIKGSFKKDHIAIDGVLR